MIFFAKKLIRKINFLQIIFPKNCFSGKKIFAIFYEKYNFLRKKFQNFICKTKFNLWICISQFFLKYIIIKYIVLKKLAKKFSKNKNPRTYFFSKKNCNNKIPRKQIYEKKVI